MDKKRIIFSVNVHSLIDVITNSSSELFIVNLDTKEEFLKELFDVLIEQKDRSCDDTTICKFDDYEYKDEFIIPDNLNIETLYACDIEYGEQLLETLLKKYFTIVQLDYKDAF